MEKELECVFRAKARDDAIHMKLLTLNSVLGGNQSAVGPDAFLSRSTPFSWLHRREDLLGLDLEDLDSGTSLLVSLMLSQLRKS
ncbi:hypothetical protein AL755_04125 [Arthrobacter sp. ERGS1:01]|uniref:hypothetical protein n=1 Tax=Arthrobacter sp. ERGS1:01 TaxID=1704044 RepID=UPI0006CB1890|nr:hypothetical protein [Arthrobacter sp. ERGS1:01]ALE04877.1 hypothetical protein AL755_04125 [Arthrobacter sp. ERGS1:01]